MKQFRGANARGVCCGTRSTADVSTDLAAPGSLVTVCDGIGSRRRQIKARPIRPATAAKAACRGGASRRAA
ncbi:hypothetical protein GCM10022255_116520 [Dactylosporangium darangshiense]|uniref:PPM-type phosphatase domain-containing protein n=1 Tax=Dactylosporangium darangshiense TaxID=579108 RepID=A0ABP8DWC0_9ACTN